MKQTICKPVATLIAAFALTIALSANAEPGDGDTLRVANLFKSDGILQRDKPIVVWGWAAPGESVTVAFAGKQAVATAAKDGTWQVTLPAMPASNKPRSMTIAAGDTTLTCTNILVGDIWIVGGQSNMEHPLSRAENGALEIVSANFPQIRIMSIPQRSGPDRARDWPQIDHDQVERHHECRGYWHECSPQTVPELSAIGYIFARRLHMATQVPIGVIDTSRWGTTVEAWTPRSALKEIDSPQVRALLARWDARVAQYEPAKALAQRIRAYNERTERWRKEGRDVSNRKPPTEPPPSPVTDFNYPGNCYAGMIAPLEGLTVRGAIFHQGYNNCSGGTPGAIMYRHLFPEMINAWRRAFNDPDMAFGILSLCTDGGAQTRDNYTEMMANLGQHIREAQYKTFLKFDEAGDKNVGFVSTYDLRRAWYHPQLKIPAGERAARWALATQYGMDSRVGWKPPKLVKMTVEPGRLVLAFDTAIQAVNTGHPVEGFAIAGADRRFHPADANFRITGQDGRGRDQYDRTMLILTSPMVSRPVHFRYAWARNPMGNVQAAGNSDIPLATQRSDDWPVEDTPTGVLGDDPPAPPSRAQWGELRQALRRIDAARRIAEAKAVLEELKADEDEGNTPSNG
jgi:sialate O-acetylesterase